MSVFAKIKLGEAMTFQRGFDITKAEQTLGPVPIVSSSGISSFHNRAKVSGPGVIIGRKGTLGTVHYVTQDFWPHDTTLWVRNFKENIPEFIAYFLRTLRLENFDTGASNPTLNRNHIHKIEVLFPQDTCVQRKIAAILIAYDDLIETNKRRIALLEKMAEELYREWFVRMRFPGWRDTPSVKGVPDGWQIKPLSELATFLNGYAFKPTHWGSDGIPIIKIKEMNSGVSSDTPRNPGDDIPSKYHFDDGAILFSWSGTLLALIWDQGPGLLNQHLFKVDPKPGIPRSFLFLAFSFSIPLFEVLTTGATMQHIKRKELSFVKVNTPPPDLLEEFDDLVAPLLDAKLAINQLNRTLSQTRDLLLPRLISGKLSVEDLDIQFPPSMCEEAA